MLTKDARQKMHLAESRFSELLATMTDHIEVRSYHLRKNQNVLVLNSNYFVVTLENPGIVFSLKRESFRSFKALI